MTEEGDMSERRPLISRESVIPVGLAVAVVVFAAISAWRVSGALSVNTSNTNHAFEIVKRDIADVKRQNIAIEAKLDILSTKVVLTSQLRAWIELLRARNEANMVVPEFNK